MSQVVPFISSLRRLCAKIPIASGRDFEVGDESLLKKNLGKVPLIVVFTQYDQLVGRKELELDGLDDERLNRKARANAEKAFDLLCMEPLRKTCKQINRSDLPPVIKVSVQPSYEDTLSELTKLTEKLVTEASDISRATTSSRNRAPEPDSEMVGIAFSRAQRVDPGLKVNATIKIGKKSTGLAMLLPKFKRSFLSYLY
ncbi:hypothetical protein FRC03_002140 [Tulasnella sp. 419]|nr:hypothetical protein FRC03_002140 [Tulasnella sp. 419]